MNRPIDDIFWTMAVDGPSLGREAYATLGHTNETKNLWLRLPRENKKQYMTNHH